MGILAHWLMMVSLFSKKIGCCKMVEQQQQSWLTQQTVETRGAVLAHAASRAPLLSVPPAAPNELSLRSRCFAELLLARRARNVLGNMSNRTPRRRAGEPRRPSSPQHPRSWHLTRRSAHAFPREDMGSPSRHDTRSRQPLPCAPHSPQHAVPPPVALEHPPPRLPRRKSITWIPGGIHVITNLGYYDSNTPRPRNPPRAHSAPARTTQTARECPRRASHHARARWKLAK